MALQTFTVGQVLTAAQVTALQNNNYNQTVSTKTANHILVAADVGTRVYMNAAGSTTITVNTGIFAAGDTLFLGNIGAGSCVVTAGTATVSKFSTASLTLSQYQGAYLYFVSTGVAILYSDSAGASLPLTTKGDLFGFDTANARVPIGANNTVLTADSAQALGLKWATPAASSVTSGNNFVSTSQTTTSTSYTDLATVQAVTITTGTKALVLLTSNLANSSASSGTRMAFAITGATTVAAADDYGINWAAGNAGDTVKYGGSFYVTGLTAGSNVFTAKFKVSAGTGTFAARFITVLDMGS